MHRSAGNVTNLKDLSLGSTRVSDAGVVHLAGLTRLKYIWLADTQVTDAGAAELERCIRASTGFIGFCVSASGMGYTADHAIYGPFYDVLKRYRRPALVLVGHTGAGAGLPGGGGLKLDLCHPRYVDYLAAEQEYKNAVTREEKLALFHEFFSPYAGAEKKQQ